MVFISLLYEYTSSRGDLAVPESERDTSMRFFLSNDDDKLHRKGRFYRFNRVSSDTEFA